MNYIQSAQNQYIKTARQLKNKKYREKTGLFLLEGFRLLEEALNADYPLEFVLAVEEVDLQLVEQLSSRCPIFFVSLELLSTVAETEHPQGILAVARQRKLSLRDLMATSSEALLMVVDGVQDPGNLGTIIRTADAAGAGGVILTANTVDLYNSKTVRASMGSLLRLKLVAEQAPIEAAKWLADHDYSIVVGHVGAQQYYYELDYRGRVAIVVGNENSGPSREFKEAGCLVKIPCRTESLNVSIAAAILLYEKVRRCSIFGET